MSGKRETTAVRVMRQVIRTVGTDRLAEALGLTKADLEPFARGDHDLTLHQQRVLAMAVLSLSSEVPELRRHASTLLAQVRATEDFRSGRTERHASPPPSGFWT